jgi:phosphoribosylformimino-5-aminoimidazole carboxamide ribotide isomerase
VIIYPAIDVRDGRCVRLVEGDFNRETTFDADPADAARRWVDSGAAWLHVVDLDGAVAGRPVNVEAVTNIRSAVDIPIQLGGGLRRLADIATAFELGINRAVLGSAAVRSPDLVQNAVGAWGDRIAVGLDARDGNLAVGGWLEQTTTTAVDVARALDHAGVKTFIFTDIRRDGTLAGPNLEALREMVSTIGAGVIASGGIGALADIEAVIETGAAGVIIGRAIYDGRVDLSDALRIARRAVTAS